VNSTTNNNSSGSVRKPGDPQEHKRMTDSISVGDSDLFSVFDSLYRVPDESLRPTNVSP
jgi:hypothetical protein